MEAKDYLKVCTSCYEPKDSDEEEVWDDGSHSGIDQILLTYTKEQVCSIQVAYNDYGRNTPSFASKHGSDGTMFQQLSFKSNSPLISVSGHYDSYFGIYDPRLGIIPYNCIKSIRFKTSSGEIYGPYGSEMGIPFSYESDSKGLAGFHGTLLVGYNFKILSYIGVYVQSSATKDAK